MDKTSFRPDLAFSPEATNNILMIHILMSAFNIQDVEHLKLANVVSLNEATQTMDTNPIKTAITVCSQLIQRKVLIV
jgi:hypothetical protein